MFLYYYGRVCLFGRLDMTVFLKVFLLSFQLWYFHCLSLFQINYSVCHVTPIVGDFDLIPKFADFFSIILCPLLNMKRTAFPHQWLVRNILPTALSSLGFSLAKSCDLTCRMIQNCVLVPHLKRFHRIFSRTLDLQIQSYCACLSISVMQTVIVLWTLSEITMNVLLMSSDFWLQNLYFK